MTNRVVAVRSVGSRNGDVDFLRHDLVDRLIAWFRRVDQRNASVQRQSSIVRRDARLRRVLFVHLRDHQNGSRVRCGRGARRRHDRRSNRIQRGRWTRFRRRRHVQRFRRCGRMNVPVLHRCRSAFGFALQRRTSGSDRPRRILTDDRLENERRKLPDGRSDRRRPSCSLSLSPSRECERFSFRTETIRLRLKPCKKRKKFGRRRETESNRRKSYEEENDQKERKSRRRELKLIF